MCAWWRRDPVIAYGIPREGGALGLMTQANVFYVDYNAGSDAKNGRSHLHPVKTITRALALAGADDIIMVAPGVYIEAITVALAEDKVTIIGMGGADQVSVVPAATNATALTVIGDNLTVEGITFTGKGTGSAVVNYGAETTLRKCGITGGTIGLVAHKATVAQAATHGTGARLKVLDSEIYANTTGVTLNGTDAGALDDPHFLGCHFHDNSAADFEEAGGTASDRWDGLLVKDCVFSRVLAGAEPTAYVLLNDDNGNSGKFVNNVIPSAVAGGKCLVSTLCLWMSNHHTDAVSTGQPS